MKDLGSGPVSQGWNSEGGKGFKQSQTTSWAGTGLDL